MKPKYVYYDMRCREYSFVGLTKLMFFWNRKQHKKNTFKFCYPLSPVFYRKYYFVVCLRLRVTSGHYSCLLTILFLHSRRQLSNINIRPETMEKYMNRKENIFKREEKLQKNVKITLKVY